MDDSGETRTVALPPPPQYLIHPAVSVATHVAVNEPRISPVTHAWLTMAADESVLKRFNAENETQ